MHEQHQSPAIADRDELRTWRMMISANRETWRLSRLADVARRIFGASPSTGDKIGEINDHKGTLTVFWSRPPTTNDLAVVAQAWDDENECDIQHQWAE